jgi:hypothetical protein
MKKKTSIIVFLISFFSGAMQLADAQQASYQDEDLSPEAFSIILKDEWVYMRDATEQLEKETGQRGEFETTSEFQARSGQARKTFLAKLNGHIKEMKLDKRIFGAWFKAELISYDADGGVYTVKCNTTVPAPYDIPNVECIVPTNPYVGMTDSVKGGYRTPTIRLIFDPDFQWKAARNDAKAAKASESNVYFKVHFMLDISQDGYSSRTRMRIIPKDIMLMNKMNNTIFWKQDIK